MAFQHFLESRVIGRPYFSLLIYNLGSYKPFVVCANHSHGLSATMREMKPRRSHPGITLKRTE